VQKQQVVKETLAKESSRFEGQLMDANKETQKVPN
jgi:hypothetical protein